MQPKNIVIAGLAALALLFAGLYYFKSSPQLFGGITVTGPLHYQAESFLQGVGFGTRNQSQFDNAGKLTVGASGTAKTQELFGTCNPTQYSPGSFAATTTSQFFCAVTGVNSGDKVFISLPIGAGANTNGSASVYMGFAAWGYATSSNQIGITYANWTGAATTTFPQATTSVQYHVIR